MKGMFHQLIGSQRGSVRDRWTSELKRIARLSGLKRGETLLFCHIPKCAGTSFRGVVESEYWPRQRLFLYKNELNLPQFLERFKAIRETVQIVYGHFSFGIHQLLDVPPCYATIVRDPVSRVVSLYHHIARDPASPFFARVNAGLPLKEFVASRFSEQTNNHMTRILVGLPVEPGVVVHDTALLEQAKENIERYFCVIGTTEAIDDVVRALAQRLGWRDRAVPALNAMPDLRTEIDKETRDIIVEHNRLDLALYEWIRVKGPRTFSGGK